MSKTITLSDEAYDFIQRTAHELDTQDSRHTDTPIYRIYETRKVERREGCGDHVERLDYDGADEHYCQSCQEILKNTDYDYDQLPDVFSDGCDCRYSDGATWTFDKKLLPATSGYDGVAFLTEKAAEEYRQDNGYHFNGGGVVYVESAFRNHELKSLIAVIKQIAGAAS